MASTESSPALERPQPVITPLAPADIGGALALVAEAGWNQVRADWELFTRMGSACKVLAADGSVAATAATLPHRPGFGWISMVLVAGAHRRQGLATALLSHCIERLRAEALVPGLDATPAGRTVYLPLGFQDGWAITRWRRTQAAWAQPVATAPGLAVRPLEPGDWPAIARLDAQAFGADRLPLLRHLAARSQPFACVALQQGRITGFLLGRDGRLATQIGPLVADGETAAQALLAHALARIEGQVLLDLVDRHAGIAAGLPAAGFAVERGYVRMMLGTGTPWGDSRRMVAIAGPELG